MPALEDDGFAVADSHGCLTYRVRKYGKDAWLPPDPEDMGKMAWLGRVRALPGAIELDGNPS